MSTAAETVTLISQELETQSLNAVVAGFSFAAAPLVDGPRPLVGEPSRQGQQERWHELHAHCVVHHLIVHRRLPLDLPSLHSCPTTISTIVRGHPLSGWLPLWN